jgi:peptide/nickel transport system permease protein
MLTVLTIGFFVVGGRVSQRARAGTPVRSGLRVGGFLAVLAVLTGVLVSLSAEYHVLGTDQVGHDVLYRSLKGCRVGLIVGTLTTLIATPLAILFGVTAGYLGGRIDDIIQYIYTTLSSIPNILLIAAAMLIVTTRLHGEQAIVASDTRLLWLCVVLGIGSWTGLCRLLRGETLKVRENEYVEAAEAFGVNRVEIMVHHLLPNVMHIVLISIILRFSGLVLAEAVLAYVGIGVDPSMESWGNMINSARLDISRDPVVWWNLLAAFLFMFGLVLPANIFGDAVRDALDPRLKTE